MTDSIHSQSEYPEAHAAPNETSSGRDHGVDSLTEFLEYIDCNRVKMDILSYLTRNRCAYLSSRELATRIGRDVDVTRRTVQELAELKVIRYLQRFGDRDMCYLPRSKASSVIADGLTAFAKLASADPAMLAECVDQVQTRGRHDVDSRKGPIRPV